MVSFLDNKSRNDSTDPPHFHFFYPLLQDNLFLNCLQISSRNLFGFIQLYPAFSRLTVLFLTPLDVRLRRNAHWPFLCFPFLLFIVNFLHCPAGSLQIPPFFSVTQRALFSSGDKLLLCLDSGFLVLTEVNFQVVSHPSQGFTVLFVDSPTQISFVNLDLQCFFPTDFFLISLFKDYIRPPERHRHDSGYGSCRSSFLSALPP